MDTSVAIGFVAVFLVHLIYKKYIDSTKDVSDIYLQEQSVIDGTRLTNQSAIYKSNKLDAGDGLRVGLDIRYDHYKLRNGNLCDVWEVFVNSLKRDSTKVFQIDDETIKISELNFMAHRLQQYFEANGTNVIGINSQMFITSIEALAVVVAAFIGQVVIDVYDDIDTIDEKNFDFLFDEGRKPLTIETINKIVGPLEELHTFENPYNFEKDKGVKLKITTKSDTNSDNLNIEYIPVNFVSSIASTIKHLPISETLTSKDKLLISQSTTRSSHEIAFMLNKLLVGFICSCDIVLSTDTDWNKLKQHNPSVICISQNELLGQRLELTKFHLSIIDQIKYTQSLKFLSRGKFSKLNKDNLRLVYCYKPLETGYVPKPIAINRLRALLGCRIICEYSYYNTLGPIILNDFYDYRLLNNRMVSNLTGYGCIFQSIEIKLVNVQEGGYGDIMIRGYSIGKTNKTKKNKANDGFMLLENFKGKWGNDGCLYVNSL